MAIQLALATRSRILLALGLAISGLLPSSAHGQSIQSWGYDGGGIVSNTPTGLGFTQITAGGYHSMALDANGSIVAWGVDGSGQVSGAPAGTGFTDIAAGGYHSLALRGDGSIVSWGSDADGQVSGTPAGTGFIHVAAGFRHSLALRVDGSIVSWGANWHGAVSSSPTGTGYTQLAGGGHHSLALRGDGSIESWGWDLDEQVTNTPAGVGFTQVAGGFYGSLALRGDGSLAAWGKNVYGVVSNAPAGTGFRQVACGNYHSMALRSDGTIASWGHDSNQQISNTPGWGGHIQLAAGDAHSLALRMGFLPPQPVHNISGATVETFATIQLAVDAAAEGDVLLVGEGIYEQFTIDGKSLSIFAFDGPVTVDAEVGHTIQVRNLGPQQRVVLSGLRVEHVIGTWTWSSRGLHLDQNQGYVYVQDCDFVLQAASSFDINCISPIGHPAAMVVDSSRVAFSRCTFQGHGGSESDDWCSDSGASSTSGGAGVSCTRSTLAISGCNMTGGGGGGSSATGTEPGGAGLELDESTVFLLDTQSQGGPAGTDDAGFPSSTGGPGVQLDGLSALHYLDSSLQGGWGFTFGPPIFGGGIVDAIPGLARVIESPRLTSWPSPGVGTFHGEAGDVVYFLTSLDPKFRWLIPLGVQQLTVTVPLAPPAGSVPGTGPLTSPLDFSALPASAAPGPIGFQGFALGAGGTRHLSGVRHMLAFDPAATPDCNMNGVNDYLDILNGTSVDSNHNLVPDECGS